MATGTQRDTARHLHPVGDLLDDERRPTQAEWSSGEWTDDERAWRLRRLLVGADVLALVLTFVTIGLAGHVDGFGSLDLEAALLLVIAVPVWLALAAAHGLYHLHSRRVEHSAGDELGPVVQMTVMWSWALLLAGELLGLKTVTVARVALFWVAATVLLIGLRALVRAVARRQAWYVHRVLVVGRSAQATSLVRKLERHPEYGLEVMGTVDVSGAAPSRPTGVVPPVVRYEDVPALATELGVHRVVLAGAPRRQVDGERFHLARDLSERGVRVDILPAWFEVLGTRLEVHEAEGTALLTVPYVHLGRGSYRVKRTFDVAVAGLALLAMLPLLAMIAVAIRLDSRGPTLFRQRRIGRWGEPFELLKFRSMHDGADEQKHAVSSLNLHACGVQPVMFKIRRDPRTTRVGAFLRRTSLDELPQLWNIVRGDMSLVGPRPLIEPEARRVEGHYRRRMTLTPGLTGLWQVNGRSEVPFEEMVNLDYLYCTTWSLWGDVKILLKTVPAVFARRGAY